MKRFVTCLILSFGLWGFFRELFTGEREVRPGETYRDRSGTKRVSSGMTYRSGYWYDKSGNVVNGE